MKSRIQILSVFVFLILLVGTAFFLVSRSSLEIESSSAAISKNGGRIKATVINGQPQFTTLNGGKFTPRGNNYIRLSNQVDTFGGGNILYHSTFDAGLFNQSSIESALTSMSQSGYNTVRIFINENKIGDAKGGLSKEYLKNVSTFISIAASKNIYTIITMPFIPKSGGYYPQTAPTTAESMNWHYLTTDAINAKKKYTKDFIAGLKANNVNFDYIFSINPANELFFVEDKKPLNQTSGTFTAANGGTYNLASEKQQMMDANLVYWINQMVDEIKADTNNQTMVGVGFFSPFAVSEEKDNRIIRTYWALQNKSYGGSSADYIDLHLYPDAVGTQKELASFEIPTNRDKPIIFGELGAFKFAFSDTTKAAFALRDFEIATCKNKQSEGWLAWTWDTNEQWDIYNVQENRGAINGVLAPIARADACK